MECNSRGNIVRDSDLHFAVGAAALQAAQMCTSLACKSCCCDPAVVFACTVCRCMLQSVCLSVVVHGFGLAFAYMFWRAVMKGV